MSLDILDSISRVGFPIVAFLLVYIDLRKIVKQNTAAIRELKDSLKRE